MARKSKKPQPPAPKLTAKEALQHHQNLIYRRCLEKLQAQKPLTEEELAEVKRRESEEAKAVKQIEPKKKPGRQSKLTTELIAKIRGYVAAGNTFKIACQLCRISETIFYKWMGATDSSDPLILELIQSVKEATAEAEAAMVARVRDASRENWTAAAWMLERRNPEVWGRRDTIKAEHSGPNGAPLQTQSQLVIYMPDNGRSVKVEPKQLTDGE